MRLEEIIAKLKVEPSVDVPFAGKVLAGLSRNASYLAASAGKLGVPTYDVGGSRRVASVLVLKKLGLLHEVEALVSGADRQPAAAPDPQPLTTKAPKPSKSAKTRPPRARARPAPSLLPKLRGPNAKQSVKEREQLAEV
jgi:hypothetical protein